MLSGVTQTIDKSPSIVTYRKKPQYKSSGPYNGGVFREDARFVTALGAPFCFFVRSVSKIHGWQIIRMGDDTFQVPFSIAQWESLPEVD